MANEKVGEDLDGGRCCGEDGSPGFGRMVEVAPSALMPEGGGRAGAVHRCGAQPVRPMAASRTTPRRSFAMSAGVGAVTKDGVITTAGDLP